MSGGTRTSGIARSNKVAGLCYQQASTDTPASIFAEMDLQLMENGHNSGSLPGLTCVLADSDIKFYDKDSTEIKLNDTVSLWDMESNKQKTAVVALGSYNHQVPESSAEHFVEFTFLTTPGNAEGICKSYSLEFPKGYKLSAQIDGVFQPVGISYAYAKVSHVDPAVDMNETNLKRVTTHVALCNKAGSPKIVEQTVALDIKGTEKTTNAFGYSTATQG